MTIDVKNFNTNTNEESIDEFLPSTKDDKSEEITIDASKASKYKKSQPKKQHEIIVFPNVKNKKTTNNSMPQTSKDTDGLKNGLY